MTGLKKNREQNITLFGSKINADKQHGPPIKSPQPKDNDYTNTPFWKSLISAKEKSTQTEDLESVFMKCNMVWLRWRSKY